MFAATVMVPAHSAGAAGVTVIARSPCLPPTVAITFVCPDATPVTTPALLTVAIEAAFVDHVGPLMDIGAPFWSVPDAVAVATCPALMDDAVKLTVTVVRTGLTGVGVGDVPMSPPLAHPDTATKSTNLRTKRCFDKRNSLHQVHLFTVVRWTGRARCSTRTSIRVRRQLEFAFGTLAIYRQAPRPLRLQAKDSRCLRRCHSGFPGSEDA